MGFKVGERVRLKKRPAETGEVLEMLTVPGSKEPWYKIRFPSGTRTVEQSALLELGIPREPEEQLGRSLFGGMNDLRLLLTYLRLKERNLTDQIRSLRAARLKHLPYQYKPLLKFLESPDQRILIADEVGLGKTIEAGLILLELMARHEVSRALIIVPSNLVLKWQSELFERFELEFEHRDNRWLRDNVLRPVVDGSEPPPFKAICALEAIRLLADEFEQAKPAIDLVIVDEAHRLRNESSLSHKLGRALGESSEGMILCSATPMQTASTNLHNLLRVMLGERAGSFADFEADLRANRPVVEATTALVKNEPMRTVTDLLARARDDVARARPTDVPLLDACLNRSRAIADDDVAGRVELLADISRLNWFGTIMTRTRKRMVMKNVAPRVARAVTIDFTPDEMEFYNAICAQTRQVAATGQWTTTFASITRQRQAASCLAAFRSEAQAWQVDPDARAALTNEFQSEEEAPETAGGGPKVPALPTDAKLKQLLAHIEELNKEDPNFKLIIFATFRPTVAYLAAKLAEAGWDYEVLTGSITDRHERVRRVQRVKNDSRCHMLLATEVGCEGIDLQFASTLVNYDLPWNPMVVEQRIGRLDRIGQNAAAIRIFNLAVNGTIEERILTRLYERLNLFERSIGALEVVIGERVQRLALDLARLSPAEQERRLDEERFALENIQRESSHLDAEATNLIGDDAYYSQRLSEIEARQGDIASDLQAFVSDFLGREFKHAALLPEGNQSGQVFRLTFDSELLAFLTGRRGEQTGPGAAFIGRYAEARNGNGLLVTFDQRAADERRNIEFLTTTHRFVRAIASRIEQQELNLVRAFSVEVRSHAMAPGSYLLALALHRVTGIRPRNELVAAGVTLTGGSAIRVEQIDGVVADLIRSGRSVPISKPIDNLTQLRQAAEVAVLSRCAEIKRSVAEQNDLFVSRRVDSLRRWYGTRIAAAQKQSTAHTDERVRRMAAGRAARLETRLSDEILRADEARAVDADASIEAFVLVNIVA